MANNTPIQATTEKGELEASSIEKKSELSVETKQIVTEFRELFKRQGKVNNYKIKINGSQKRK